MKEFKKWLERRGYKLITINNTLREVRKFEAWRIEERLSLKEVQYKDILAYISFLKGTGMNPVAINRYIIGIKKYFNYLLDSRKVSQNPCQTITIRGITEELPPVLLKKEELDKLYDQFNVENKFDVRDKAIIGLMVYQGLTMREVLQLRLSDIQLNEAKITIKGNYRSNRRVLTFESKQILYLYSYLLKERGEIINSNDSQEERVFINTRANKNLNGIFQRLKKKLRSEFVSFISYKQIRVSVIVNWLKTENIRVVQYKAGHRYISSTEKYQQYDMDNLKEFIDQSHPFSQLNKGHN